MKITLLVLLGLLLVLAAVAAVVAVVAVANWRWRARTAGFLERLQDHSPGPSAVYSSAQLEGLPAPVAAYFRAVLREGQPMLRGGRLTQEGDFLVQPEKNGWGPFKATHHFLVGPPGFVWDAKILMGHGLSVQVRDAFVDGQGSMNAGLLGVIRLVSVEGTPEIAAGSLHRYLAEAPWYPTALLPSQGVVWTPIDEKSARATLSVGATTVSLDFRFRGDGLVDTVYTPARSRDVKGHSVPTPWQGRFSDYAERGGVLIPLRGEVGWLLPEGPQLYWRGRITEVSYERTER